MCISCSLHYFIGCSLFGFEFQFKCHVQTQKHLVVFASFLSFRPSPAGPSPLSSFSFCSPAQPAALSLFPSFFLPCAARSPPAHGLSPSFPLSFLPRARTAHSFSPRPIGAPASPFSPYRLTGGARLSGPSPPPHRTRARVRLVPASSSPPPPQARTPKHPQPPLLKPPHLPHLSPPSRSRSRP
jgi:hypothetical protein